MDGFKFGVLVGLALTGASAAAQPAADVSRGQLLYDTHCLACHSEKLHWRDGRLVKDWPTLKDQVRRFQAVANLAWSDADIAEVASYLNRSIYRLPQAGMATVGRPGAGIVALTAMKPAGLNNP
jgi:mono/diheme cytochrome c family protein